MTALALALSLFSLLLAGLPLFRTRSRATMFLWVPTFLGAAWTPWVALSGALGAMLGAVVGSIPALVAGLVGLGLAADTVRRVTARHDDGFARAFGPDWRTLVGADAEGRMLARRWAWRAPLAPPAQVEKDVPFATVPGSGRELLCDVWRPRPGQPSSGTAIVYLHGSAWCLLDKDVGTRPLFAHLVAQGHVVVDVAYRLCPETDFTGMVADAKRAVAWIVDHAADYGVRPDRVVLMGGSAGGHAALLAAFTPGHPDLTPDDLRGVDTSVRAVVSFYGVPDLRAYEAFARTLQPPRETPRPGPSARMRRLFPTVKDENLPPPPPHRQLMTWLVGGLPEEVGAARYELASPICHVGPHCPASLLLYGTHDHIVPIESARRLHEALVAAGVPSVFVEYPRTGHAFDLFLPALSAPAAQAALYDLERFLACATSDARHARARPRLALPAAA